LEKGLHVSVFSPARIADWIISTLPLVSGVVTAGTVGSRDAKVELFFVIELALDVHPHCADSDDYPAVASDVCCEVHRCSAFLP